MALLPPLATAADLAARNIAVPDGMDPDAILASAAAAVREAAGCPIAFTTSTAVLIARQDDELALPGGPVASVESVTMFGDPVTDWRKVGNSIIRAGNWADEPTEVVVTYSHGYRIVPADIVDLTCAIAAMAFRQDGDYGLLAITRSVHLGDYSVNYARQNDQSPSPVSIPAETAQRLRARFGTSVAAIRMGGRA